MARPVVHFEIGASNLAKSMEFYKSIFDWDISEPPGMKYGMVEAAGDKAIGGGLCPVEGETKPYVTFYIEVDNLQEYLDKVESRGGKTVFPPTPIPGVGSFAWFSDIDGNCVGLFKGE